MYNSALIPLAAIHYYSVTSGLKAVTHNQTISQVKQQKDFIWIQQNSMKLQRKKNIPQSVSE